MAQAHQLWLPRLKGVKRRKRPKQPPQPRVDEFREIKQFELFHRPFDLRFRGRINKWIVNIKQQKKFKLSDIVTPIQRKVINLYFFPEKESKKWLNQDHVLVKVNLRSKKKLKEILVSALIRLWKKDKE